MTAENRQEAIKYIKAQLENGYIDLGINDRDELEIINESMDVLICLNQYKWERDVIIEQLEKLGISFGKRLMGFI